MYDRLKGAIYRAGYTIETFSKEVGIHPLTFSRKMRGLRQFTVGEIRRIRDILNLTDEELLDIFFNSDLQKCKEMQCQD